MGCLLDDLRAFEIDADQWATEAQDEGEWLMMAEQGAERFLVTWATAEKVRVGLRDASSSMPARDGKDQGEDIPGQACSSWFARRC